MYDRQKTHWAKIGVGRGGNGEANFSTQALSADPKSIWLLSNRPTKKQVTTTWPSIKVNNVRTGRYTQDEETHHTFFWKQSIESRMIVLFENCYFAGIFPFLTDFSSHHFILANLPFSRRDCSEP